MHGETRTMEVVDDTVRQALQQQAVDGFRDARVAMEMQKRKIGRNELCPCGSKIKFKKCHGKPKGVKSDGSQSIASGE